MHDGPPFAVDVVIVNYRTPDLTVQCLRSLVDAIGPANPAAGAEVNASGYAMPIRVIVIDNNSGDDSVEKIARAIDDNAWGEWVILRPLDRNYGFAGGNNRGLQALPSGGDYVLLLNSDTLVDPGVLQYCLALMQRERSIGVMSCMLRNPDGTPQNTARKFPTPLRQVAGALGLPWLMPKLFAWADTEDPGWDRRTCRRDVDWLGGAFLFIRRETLDRIGPLDEDFFFYGEDIEFCHRVRRAGWRCRYDPSVAITHLGGASSDPVRLAERQRSLHIWQARYLVQRKCYGRGGAAAVRAADVLACALRCLKLLLAGRRRDREYHRRRQVLGMLLRPLSAQAGPTASEGGTA